MTEGILARQTDHSLDTAEEELMRQAQELERLTRQYAQIEEKLAAERQEDLDDLFHIDPAYAINNPQEAAWLKAEFLERKKGKNLGECFALSLEEPFFGRVHVVKLASTDHSEPGASLDMFREANDFLHWMVIEGPLKGVAIDGENGELISHVMGNDEINDAIEKKLDPGDDSDRLKSKRWMEYEFFDDEDGNPEHQVAIIRRIRPFVKAEVELNGEMCSMMFYKETTFTIRAMLLQEILFLTNHTLANNHHDIPDAVRNDPNPINTPAMRQIERWLYTSEGDMEDVQRISHYTAMYSAVVPHSVDRRMMEAYES